MERLSMNCVRTTGGVSPLAVHSFRSTLSGILASDSDFLPPLSREIGTQSELSVASTGNVFLLSRG